MTFQIISCGWTCADALTDTLRSIESQTVTDWRAMIVYEPSDDDGADQIVRWCDSRDDRWHYQINTRRQFTVRNQVEAIAALDPADEDVIVWLDLDGDRLAHPDVLAHLADAYSDSDSDVWLCYGTYRPVPDDGLPVPVEAYPPDVVASNGYRRDTLSRGPRWNHLRSMRAKLVKAMPDHIFKQADGSYTRHGADYIFMTAGLELAGGRHRYLPEVTYLYRADNPHADNREHPDETNRCVVDFLRRPPLDPLS